MIGESWQMRVKKLWWTKGYERIDNEQDKIIFSIIAPVVADNNKNKQKTFK